jgi:hypothetical protein
MDISITTGIYSIDRIDAAARDAVNNSVPHDKANIYPQHSIAHFAFAKAYATSAQVAGQSVSAVNPRVGA